MQQFVIDVKARQPICSVKPEMPYQDKSDEESDGGDCNVSVIDGPDPVCLICVKKDHNSYVSPFTGKRKVSYFACDKFLNASPATQNKILDEKEFCRKCLRVGAKSGHKHCHDTYVCRHPSHDPQKGHHVLVCEKHKKIPENEKLLDKFKREVIYKHEDLPSKIIKNLVG